MMSGASIFFEDEKEFRIIRDFLNREGYYLNVPTYSEGIYQFEHCIRLGDSLIYRIIARLIDEEVDYMSEVVGLYIDDEEI